MIQSSSLLSVEDEPWGYPRVSRYCNSDECFAIYRRFGEVFARLVLNKQAEMTELEEELRAMDMHDSNNGQDKSRRLMSMKFDRNKGVAEGQTKTRKELFAEIEEKAIEYSLSEIRMVVYQADLTFTRQTVDRGTTNGSDDTALEARL